MTAHDRDRAVRIALETGATFGVGHLTPSQTRVVCQVVALIADRLRTMEVDGE